MPEPVMVLSKLEMIESELHILGWWQADPLDAGQYDFKAAFASDTMTFSQWLQFIFIPNAKRAAINTTFPSSSQVGAQAVREFDGLEEAGRLIALLAEFDALFS